MSASPLILPDITQLPGTSALPRHNGEIVFHTDWERRAFAIVVSLVERGQFQWSEFQLQLIDCIGEAERDDPQNPDRGYYESWLASLELLLRGKHLVPPHALWEIP